MKAGNYNLKMYEVEGWHLLVPQSLIDATQEEVEEKTGGCGPGSIGDWFVPDTMYGESVFLACQIHDWMYGEGVNEEDKFYADMVFDWNMKVLIIMSPETDEIEGETLDAFRLRRASTYFLAVHLGGDDAFRSGKTLTKAEINSKP